MPVELFIQMENSKGSILAANYAAHTPSSLEPNGNRKKFSLMRYFTQTYRNFIMKLVVMKPSLPLVSITPLAGHVMVIKETCSARRRLDE